MSFKEVTAELFCNKLKAGYLECTIRMLHVTVNRRSVE